MAISNRRWSPLWAIWLLFLTFFGQNARSVELVSGPAQVNLIELFTSEGCSSCPNADRWLGALQREPSLWKSFVPISFHVDYWNKLGWMDAYSEVQFTQRQESYASSWGSGGVYTPGFVLNGKEWRRDKGLKPLGLQNNQVGILKLSSLSDGQFMLSFSPTPNSARQKWTGHIALLGNGLQTKVMAGENVGKTLTHEFVVLKLASAKLPLTQGSYRATIALPKSGNAASSYALAAWVTGDDRLAPVQATGGDWRP